MSVRFRWNTHRLVLVGFSMEEARQNILAVLVRVPVDNIEAAKPLYQRLAGTRDARTFVFGTVRLAWVGPFLLLEGADTAARARAATIIVRSIDEIVAAVEAGGGVLLEGPMPGPNGRRLVADHRDGNVIEYVEHPDTAR